jgi:hypothetical protein
VTFLRANAHARAIGLALALLGVLALPAASALEAGAAKIEFTPPLGTPLNGAEDRLGLGAQSIHDPLYVRALFLDDESTALFLLVADLYEITPALQARVTELCPLDLPEENVILVATGTHNGPGGMDRALAKRVVSGRYLPDFTELTARTFAEAMRNAYDLRQRSTIAYATTTQNVFVRNAILENGPIADRIGDRLGVIRVDDADGNPIAILGSLGAPANTLGEELRFAFSADFPGVFCQSVEDLSTQGCVAFFLPGPAADQEIVDPENHTGAQRTESAGNLVAVRVKSLANNLQGRELQLGLRSVTNPLPRTLASHMLPAESRVTVLTIDRLAVTFVAGLPYAEIGASLNQIAESAGYRDAFVVSLAGPGLGMHAPPQRYATATGPRWNTHFGPGYERWATSAARELFNKSQPESPTAEFATDDDERYLTLSGTPYARGLALGAHYLAPLDQAYDQRVRATLETGEGESLPYAWKLAPSAVDLTPLTAPRAAAAARARLAGVAPVVIEHLLGVADGAEMPFDALWLLHTAPAPASAPVLVGAAGNPAAGKFGAVWAGTPDSGVRAIVSHDADTSVIALVHAAEGRTLAGLNAAFAALALPIPPDRPQAACPPSIALDHLLHSAGSTRAASDALAVSGFAMDADLIVAAQTETEWLRLNWTGARERVQPLGPAPYAFGTATLDPAAEAPPSLKEILLAAARRDANENARSADAAYTVAIFNPSAGSAEIVFLNARFQVESERVLTLDADE